MRALLLKLNISKSVCDTHLWVLLQRFLALYPVWFPLCDDPHVHRYNRSVYRWFGSTNPSRHCRNLGMPCVRSCKSRISFQGTKRVNKVCCNTPPLRRAWETKAKDFSKEIFNEFWNYYCYSYLNGLSQRIELSKHLCDVTGNFRIWICFGYIFCFLSQAGHCRTLLFHILIQ